METISIYEAKAAVEVDASVEQRVICKGPHVVGRYFYMIERTKSDSSPFILSASLYETPEEAEGSGLEFARTHCPGHFHVSTRLIREDSDDYLVYRNSEKYVLDMRLRAAEDAIWQRRRNPDGMLWSIILAVASGLILFYDADMNPYLAWLITFIGVSKAIRKIKWYYFPK